MTCFIDARRCIKYHIHVLYNSLNKHTRYIEYQKSPASQICLVVESPASFDGVTCLPPKNASAPWGGVGSRWLTIIVQQVSWVQYLLACQKLQRPTPYNIVKNCLPWKRVFRRRHLGRRVTAVTCLRWPTVCWAPSNRQRGKTTMGSALNGAVITMTS